MVGASDSALPFGTLFTGLVINQLYFWGMNQTIIQRALGAKSLVEAQKGLLITGLLKNICPSNHRSTWGDRFLLFWRTVFW